MKLFRSVLLSFVLVSDVVIADDWPQFLGPHRNGMSAEVGLADSFPADGPKISWRVPVGAGMSGVAVSEGLLLTMYQDAADQFVIALDAASGKKVWQNKVAAAYENAMGNGPRATPTIAAEHVYSFSGEGILTAIEMKTGKVIWSADAVKASKGKPSEYGMASSPLVVDDVVIVQAGGTDGTVVAYDLKNGQRKWSAGRGTAGYSSPVLLTLSGRRQVVAFAGGGVLGIDPATGKQLWQFRYETDYDCNTASPVQLNDSTLLISAGENHGATILDIKMSGDEGTASATWTSLGNDSVLRAEWQTPVLLDGHLFALDNVGSAGPITNLVCVRVSDGEQLWNKTRFGKSNCTYADGKLFLSTMKGELVIVKASTAEFTESARAEVLGMTRQAPVISNGLLYLRDDREVVCVDIRK